MNKLFGSLIEHLQTLWHQQSAVLIGIDGPGGAGKTTFAQMLTAHLKATGRAVTIVHHDDFFLPSARRLDNQPEAIGGDFDWQRLRDQVLLPLKENRPGRYQRYDWGEDALAEWHTVSATGAVIVEGVYTLRLELADLYDFKVWVECPGEIRLARGLARDGEEARAVWEQDWMPKEDRYVEIHRPDERADLRVNGSISRYGDNE